MLAYKRREEIQLGKRKEQVHHIEGGERKINKSDYREVVSCPRSHSAHARRRVCCHKSKSLG